MTKKLLAALLLAAVVAAAFFWRDVRRDGKSYDFARLAYATELVTPNVTRMISPDGRFVAYGVKMFNEVNQLITKVVVRATDGSSEREVGEVIGGRTDILWLGNDKIGLTADSAGVRSLALKYAVLDVDGRRLPDIELPGELKHSYYKLISPDGKRIAVTDRLYRPGMPFQQGLFVYDLETGNIRNLIEMALRSTAAWSPDSRKLAIGAAEGYVRDYPLWVVDVETGAIEKTPVHGVGAAWSPDGRHIACTTEGKKGHWYRGVPCTGKLGIYDVIARRMRVLPGTDGAIMPTWSKAGKWIAYNAKGKVCVVRSAGGSPRELFDGGDRSPVTWASHEVLYGISGRQPLYGISGRQPLTPPDADDNWADVRVFRADMKTGDVRMIAEWREPRRAPIGWSAAQ